VIMLEGPSGDASVSSLPMLFSILFLQYFSKATPF
jgi:hypothetical protein